MRACRRILCSASRDFILASAQLSQATMGIPGSKKGKSSGAQNQRSGRLILTKVDEEWAFPEAWRTRAESTFTSIIPIFLHCRGRCTLDDGPPLPGNWKKYFQGAFTEPGLGGRETPIIDLYPSVSWYGR